MIYIENFYEYIRMKYIIWYKYKMIYNMSIKNI